MGMENHEKDPVPKDILDSIERIGMATNSEIIKAAEAGIPIETYQKKRGRETRRAEQEILKKMIASSLDSNPAPQTAENFIVNWQENHRGQGTSYDRLPAEIPIDNKFESIAIDRLFVAYFLGIAISRMENSRHWKKYSKLTKNLGNIEFIRIKKSERGLVQFQIFMKKKKTLVRRKTKNPIFTFEVDNEGEVLLTHFDW